MELNRALNGLEKSWSREIALERIKNGESSDQIIEDFLKSNNENIETISNYINDENIAFIYQLEELTDCEIKLLKRIRDLKKYDVEKIKTQSLEKKLVNKEKKLFEIGLFMDKWSNKLVIGILITISLISLTKQAWAQLTIYYLK